MSQARALEWIAGLALALTLAAACLLLLGCDERKPEAIAQTSNTDFEVVRLFEHEGCRVYRFYDQGAYRYYVHCRHGNARTGSTESRSCGKSCTRTDHYETETTTTQERRAE